MLCLCLCLSLFLRLSVCQSVSQTIRQSVSLSVCLCLSFSPSPPPPPPPHTHTQTNKATTTSKKQQQKDTKNGSKISPWIGLVIHGPFRMEDHWLCVRYYYAKHRRTVIAQKKLDRLCRLPGNCSIMRQVQIARRSGAGVVKWPLLSHYPIRPYPLVSDPVVLHSPFFFS